MRINHQVIKYVLTTLLLGGFLLGFGQGQWTWSPLPDMPEPVSNNAVTYGYSGDSLCVYSFTGIDTTKSPSGIHLKSWRYNTVSEEWIALPDVPDFQGKIAASASTINNLIYVVGGYYVNEDFTEISSDDLHIFNPVTNTWLADGALIPTPIDDHVYDIWRDSLLFIVTGWSDSNNVRKVQIYDPSDDSWLEGTDLPISSNYSVFGGSGSIIGDTIFYIGGVNNSFNTMSRFRKGVINPDNPTEIEWSVIGECPFGDVYRSASMNIEDRLFFVGGSADGYNFDGISYSSGTGVPVESRILSYLPQWDYWDTDIESPYGLMDLRGIAEAGTNRWIICGGMEDGQEVSPKAYLLEFDASIGMDKIDSPNHYISVQDNSIICNIPQNSKSIYLHDLQGRLVATYENDHSGSFPISPSLKSGNYVFSASDSSNIIIFNSKLTIIK